jgi:hypothetical protein
MARDLFFISSETDTHNLVGALIDRGLKFIENFNSNNFLSEPRVDFVAEKELRQRMQGGFYILRPEWIYGDFLFGEGYSERLGRKYYGLNPRTNHASLYLGFYKEMYTNGQKRLGFGTLTYHPIWLKKPETELHPAPKEALEDYQYLVKKIREGGKYITIAKRRHLVMADALAKFHAGEYLLPDQIDDKAATIQLSR